VARATNQQATQDSASSDFKPVLTFKSVLRPEGSNSSEKRAAVWAISVMNLWSSSTANRCRGGGVSPSNPQEALADTLVSSTAWYDAGKLRWYRAAGKVAVEPAGQQQMGCVWSRWPLLSHAESAAKSALMLWDPLATACVVFWPMLSLVYHKKCQVHAFDWLLHKTNLLLGSFDCSS